MRLQLLASLRPVERLAIAALACLLLMMMVPFALAQTASDAVTSSPIAIDVGPLLAAVIEFVAPIVLAIGGPLALWVLGRLLKWLGLKQDALQRATIEQGLDRAIGYAVSKVGDRAIGGIPISVKNEAIAYAAGYASTAIPKALQHFKKSSQDIADMVEARLDSVLVDPESDRKTVFLPHVSTAASGG